MATNGSNSPRSSRGKGAGGKKKLHQWAKAINEAKVSAVTKSVCKALAYYLSNDSFEKGWPVTIKQLMADTGWSNRTVITHLAKAEEAGLIRKRLCADAAGHRSATRYYPTFPEVCLSEPGALRDTPGLSEPHASLSERASQQKREALGSSNTGRDSKGGHEPDRTNPYLAAKEGIEVKAQPGHPNPLAAWERHDGEEVLP